MAKLSVSVAKMNSRALGTGGKRRRGDRQLVLVALEELGLEARVDALLARQLAVVVGRGVERLDTRRRCNARSPTAKSFTLSRA